MCGYMGLDGASGSAAETQKLNFEEQPDSRVRAHGRRGAVCVWGGEGGAAIPSPILTSPLEGTGEGRGLLQLPLQESKDRWGCGEIRLRLSPRAWTCHVTSNGAGVR